MPHVTSRALKVACTCALSVLSTVSARQAYAQDVPSPPAADAREAEIIVTANRRAERLQDVPMAVNVLSNQSLKTAAISDTQFLATLVPGLSITRINSSQYYLRGVGFSGTAVNAEQSVASYIDGVYVFSTYGSISLANLDRVEVLRGPQGTLFGRNTTGGVIQAVTRDPLAKPALEASLGYANYDTLSGAFYGNAHPTDTLGISLAVDFRHQGDGFGVNTTTGRDTFKRSDITVRGKIAYQPSGNTKVTGFFQYRHMSDSGINYIPIAGTRGLDGVDAAAYGRFGNRAEAANDFKLDSYLGYIRVEQGIGDVATLTSITSYDDVQPFPKFDSDATPLPISIATQDLFFHNFSQEFQLSSKSSKPLSWIVGAYYYRAFAGMTPLDIKGTSNGPAGEVRFFRKQRTRSLAGFGQLTYELTPSTKLTAGLRYTDESEELADDLYTLVGTDPNPTRLVFPPVPLGKLDSSGWTWRLAVDQKFGDGVMGYISWNRGLKGGGFTLVTTSNIPPYKPEKLDSYEAGLKMEFLNGRVRINPALFLYKFRNIQVNSFNGFLTALANAAKATLWGVDIDAAAKIGDRFQVTGAFEYLHTRYDRFPNAIFFQAKAAPAGGATQINNQDATGNSLPYAPTTSGSLGLSYTAPLAGGDLMIDGSLRYVDSQFVGPSNIFKMPSYTLVGAGIGWTTSDKRFSVRVWGDNMFDKDYSYQIFESGSGIFRNPGAPRTFGVTLSTRM